MWSENEILCKFCGFRASGLSRHSTSSNNKWVEYIDAETAKVITRIMDRWVLELSSANAYPLWEKCHFCTACFEARDIQRHAKWPPLKKLVPLFIEIHKSFLEVLCPNGHQINTTKTLSLMSFFIYTQHMQTTVRDKEIKRFFFSNWLITMCYYRHFIYFSRKWFTYEISTLLDEPCMTRTKWWWREAITSSIVLLPSWCWSVSLYFM